MRKTIRQAAGRAGPMIVVFGLAMIHWIVAVVILGAVLWAWDLVGSALEDES